MRNFRSLVLGLVLLSLAGVSRGEETNELVLYCVYEAFASINRGEAISSEITSKNTFKINTDSLKGAGMFALPVVHHSEKLIVAQDSYFFPGDMFSETYTFRPSASGYTTVHSVTKETDGFISYGTCTKF